MTAGRSPSHGLLGLTSSRIRLGALAVLAVVSIPMIIAEVQQNGPSHPPSTHASPPISTGDAHAPMGVGMPAPSGLVLQLTTQARSGLFTARVLAPRGSDVFTSTGKSVELAIPPSTPAEMGSLADLKPGAVLEVSSHASAAGVIVANSIIVLTGHVHVQ